MTEEDLSIKLSRSPSGSLRPLKRPPIKRSSSCGGLTKEHMTIINNSASFNDSSNSQQNDISHDDKNRNKTNLEDDVTSSEENSDHENDIDENSEHEQFKEQDEHIDERENTKTSVFSQDVTDQSTCTSFVNRSRYKHNTSNLNHTTTFIYYAMVTVMVVIGGVILSQVPAEQSPDIQTIRANFLTQDDDLWIYLESGIKDIDKFNKPATFILLYTAESENTLERLLKELSRYAICKITDCSKNPIVVTHTELNSPEMTSDYGRIIDKYRSQLEERGVMIIKNLENVKGVSAQAFHSFCDEISPAVERSLFIFTVKIDQPNIENKFKFVDEYFKNKWTDINIDTFNALITRMSSMVLEIKP